MSADDAVARLQRKYEARSEARGDLVVAALRVLADLKDDADDAEFALSEFEAAAEDYLDTVRGKPTVPLIKARLYGSAGLVFETSVQPGQHMRANLPGRIEVSALEIVVT